MSNSAIQTLPSVSRRQCLSSMLAGATGSQLALRSGSHAASANETAIGAMQPIRSCIVLFHYGGPSHLESFDPKPALNKYAGKTIPETPFGDVLTYASGRSLIFFCSW